MAEALQQQYQPRTVAHDVRGLVQNDFDAVGAVREQKFAEQIIALRGVEIAPDTFIEYAYGMRGIGDQLIERRVVRNDSCELAFTGHAFWRHGQHRG